LLGCPAGFGQRYYWRCYIIMAVDEKHLGDVDIILSHRFDLGGDYWTTPDKRLAKGGSFSAYSSALMLLELGMEPNDPLLQNVTELFFKTW